jgi:hypothetical protein
MLAARRGKKLVLPQGVAHQAARRVFKVGIKNRLMPRELAANVLPALLTPELPVTIVVAQPF